MGEIDVFERENFDGVLLTRRVSEREREKYIVHEEREREKIPFVLRLLKLPLLLEVIIHTRRLFINIHGKRSILIRRFQWIWPGTHRIEMRDRHFDVFERSLPAEECRFYPDEHSYDFDNRSKRFSRDHL